MYIAPQKILDIIYQLIIESSKAFKIAFKEVQTGLQSHPDPLHLGELPPPHIMSLEDHFKLHLDEKLRRSGIILFDHNTYAPCTKGGFEVKFGGGKPAVWQFTDSFKILNMFFEKPIKKINSHKPEPFYFKSDAEYKEFVRFSKVQTDQKIKKMGNDYVFGFKNFQDYKKNAQAKLLEDRNKIIQAMLSEIKYICQPYFYVILPKYQANKNQLFDLLRSTKLWENNNLKQAYETLRRLLHFVDSPLLNYSEKKDISHKVQAWLTGKIIIHQNKKLKQDGIVTAYLKNIAAYDALQESLYSPSPQYRPNPNGLNNKGKPYQDDIIEGFLRSR